MPRALPRLVLACVIVALVAGPAAAAPKRALFDNLHAQTAGNADWIVDTDQPDPVPAPSTVTWATPENTWLGAISAWGIQLAKRGYGIATLGSGRRISYLDPTNPYDLSTADVFIVDEPNTRFTTAESTAVFDYVRDGGGLIAISDHDVSDRNNDGWDSPKIWNALDSQHLWGVRFGSAGDPNNNIVQTSFNVSASPTDSIIRGSAGIATSIAYHNGTTMTLYPAVNPSVRGNAWMTGVAQGSTAGVMVAQSVYGNGRIVFAGDSSPADDGSAQPGNTVYNGWAESGGSDSLIFLNASLWASRRDAVDATPPSIAITAPAPDAEWGTGSAHNILWSASDNLGVTLVDLAYSRDDGASWTPLASGPNGGSFGWTLPASPSDSARVRAIAHDAAGNTAPATSGRFRVTDVIPPSAVVTAPAGGETWDAGGDQAVNWTASDNGTVDSVNVDYSLHGADGPWLPVAHGLPNSGSATWTLPLEASDSARVRVTVVDHAGNAAAASSGGFVRVVIPPPTDAGDTPLAEFALLPPAPNPAPGPVTLRFMLPGAGRARLEILDVAGRRVWSAGRGGPGRFVIAWDGRDAAGAAAPAGLYLVRLTGPWGVRNGRLLRLR